MTTHKMLASFLAALILLSVVPLALAAETPTATLGDGAPIPYLDGFQSRLIKDTSMIKGITGKVDLSWQQTDSNTIDKQSHVSIQIQNIALTDDVLAVFYRAEYPDFLPLRFGTAQLSYEQAAPYLQLTLVGAQLPIINMWREGRPDGDKAVLCLDVYSLKAPIPEQSTLAFEANYNNDTKRYDTTAFVILNQGQAKDPTLAYNLNQPVSFSYERYKGQKTNFEFTVKRLSFGPFGNRMHLIIKDKGRDSGILNCLLEDDQGNALSVRSRSDIFNTLASPVNPIDMHNEIWFYGGETAQAIRIVPVKILFQTAPTTPFHTLRLDSAFPITLPLKNGTALTVNGVTLDESGFTVRYISGSPNDASFVPGDSEGQALNDLFYTSSSSFDLPSQAFLMQGLWMAGHKGQAVSRPREEYIKKFTTLLISSYAQDHEIPMPELAVQVPIK